jgi:hypothetical protein
VSRVEREFRRAREEASEVFPRASSVGLTLDWEAGRSGRSFAFCDYGTPRGNGVYIACSPRLEQEDAQRIRAIIRHEFGHAIDAMYARSTIEQRLGRIARKGWPERMADDIACAVWGEPIYYDAENVQTTRRTNCWVRPSHLPR